ncbi:MAG TPA: hypothetical protein VI968_00650 [archaeon]|nr:hypothetical protein [archaeon]
MKPKVGKEKYVFIQSLIKEITEEVKSGEVSEESMLGWYLINHDFPNECEAALKKLPKAVKSEFVSEIEKRKKTFDNLKDQMTGNITEEYDVDYIG